jgi:outer membrane receptor protein involved in Fe transport
MTSAVFALSLLLGSARPALAQIASSVAVTGVVQDQTGAVLPGAHVDLVTAAGAVVQSTTADGAGGFRFDQVAPGQYQLTARFEGFTPATSRIRVTGRAPGSQRLVLNIAGLTQEITVSNAVSAVGATAANNVDAVSVDTAMLESLPVFDNDYVATMSRFLDAGSLGNAGVTIVVNGMEVSALNVSASAVQQIRINQDPYSAEYSRPGRGRVEILTRPGGQEYHGDLNAIVRDARLNARNPFATTKPPEERRIAEGFFGGPLGGSGKTSFMLSANDEARDQQAFIHAVGLNGIIDGAIPQASGRALVSGSITRQISDRNTLSVRPNYQYESDENRGAGGTTLASAATTFTHHEQQITFTDQAILRPNLLNQFQLLVGHEREPTTSATADRGIVVAGAFTGGGGQGDLLRTETHAQLNESLAWTTAAHLVQAGVQLPDWSRRGFYDRTNAGGTFYFSALDTYASGRPYAFIQQQGNGDLAFLEKQVGAYVKDDWQLRPGLSIGLGLRYDWQNYFHDENNVAPRVSVAYAPGNSKANVFRAGAGVFNDRSGPVVIADLLHSLPGGLTRIVLENPGYPDPFGSAPAAAAPSIVRLAPDVQIPQTLQYSAGWDHQLLKATTMSATYTGARGYHLFRSRDVNAPLAPLYLARPDPAYGVVRQVESTGRQNSDSLQVTVRGRVTRWFNGQVQYTLSRVDNDTSGIASFPANDYDLSGEWAPADFDRRHRFLVLGRVTTVQQIDFGVGLTMFSGSPYSETLGDDVYNNGRGHARPSGVPRNSLVTSGYASLDLRASRDLTIGGATSAARTVTLALDAFNLLNQVNYSSFVGTVGSPLFGQPVTALSARQLQFSARLKF